MTRLNCGPDHPWRQYRKRLGPTAREIAVAEIMAEECTASVKTVQPGRPYLGPKQTADDIARRLDMKPANVRNVMVQIRKRLGPQAC